MANPLNKNKIGKKFNNYPIILNNNYRRYNL